MNRQPRIGEKVWLLGYGEINGKFDWGIVQDEVVDTKWSSVVLKNQTKQYNSSELFETKGKCETWYRTSGVQYNCKNLKRGQRVWFFYHKKNSVAVPRREDIYIDSGIVVDVHRSAVYLKGVAQGLQIDTVYTSEDECWKEMKKVVKSGEYRIRKYLHWKHI